jgi:hypothetical protein
MSVYDISRSGCDGGAGDLGLGGLGGQCLLLNFFCELEPRVHGASHSAQSNTQHVHELVGDVVEGEITERGGENVLQIA